MDATFQNIQVDKYYTGRPTVLTLTSTDGANPAVIVPFYITVRSDALVTISWDEFDFTSNGNLLTFNGFKEQFVGTNSQTSHVGICMTLAGELRAAGVTLKPSTGQMTIQYYDGTAGAGGEGKYDTLANGVVGKVHGGSMTLARLH